MNKQEAKQLLQKIGIFILSRVDHPTGRDVIAHIDQLAELIEGLPEGGEKRG